MMRLRLQILKPVSARCNWNRRDVLAVAVSGERFRNAANRLQLRIVALQRARTELERRRVPDHALHAAGWMASVFIGKLPSWMSLTTPRSPQAADRTISTLSMISNLQVTRTRRPAARLSELSRSDLVRWPFSSFRCDAKTCRLSGQSGHGMSDSALRACRSRRVCDSRSPTAPKRFMDSFLGRLVGEVAAPKDESPHTDMSAATAHRHAASSADNGTATAVASAPAVNCVGECQLFAVKASFGRGKSLNLP